jgi:hypothetical protein
MIGFVDTPWHSSDARTKHRIRMDTHLPNQDSHASEASPYAILEGLRDNRWPHQCAAKQSMNTRCWQRA